MHSVVRTFALHGVDAIPVEVQVVVSSGYPQMTLVGLPDTSVRESKERISAAFRQADISLPPKRTTVNLAPAEVKKEGSGFDLPIALALLAAHGLVETERIERLFAIGEISLDGRLLRVRGALPCALAAARSGGTLLLPAGNVSEVEGVDGLEAVGLSSLRELALWLDGGDVCSPAAARSVEGSTPRAAGVDLSSIGGQLVAKRALEIAAAGDHNLLFVGPPGTGKTLLAQALPSILPPLTDVESLEVTIVHSVAGLLREGAVRVRTRPFRAPHHTVSAAGLVGGGAIPRPGEVSLAHRGVLFLDELPEFRTGVLDLLRQPLEEGEVRIVRAGRSVRFPSRVSLVAAMNPCPCGFLGSEKPCRCTPSQVQRYRGRIGGPLLDRMDLHVEVPTLIAKELPIVSNDGLRGDASSAVAERVLEARRLQIERYAGLDGVFANAHLDHDEVPRQCVVDGRGRALLERAADAFGFSARAIHRCLRVSRTIADLGGRGAIEPEHVLEAIQYRVLDRSVQVTA
ncbi:MAG: YifB family Mg chelatase-like AAA ATPase [Candidatus Eisenbacteria bacterium]|nr:YifB family Mg chelatase-like AAA ATPase [Candidatus Eisenbacteria bacterium]